MRIFHCRKISFLKKLNQKKKAGGEKRKLPRQEVLHMAISLNEGSSNFLKVIVKVYDPSGFREGPECGQWE